MERAPRVENTPGSLDAALAYAQRQAILVDAARDFLSGRTSSNDYHAICEKYSTDWKTVCLAMAREEACRKPGIAGFLARVSYFLLG